jgi:hypothetical protein
MIIDGKAKTSRTKVVTLPKSYDRTGGCSESTLFNESNWGEITQKYMDIVTKLLRPTSFEKVIKKTKEMMKTTTGQGGSRSTEDAMDVDNADPYGQVVDLSESDSG